MTVSGIKGSSQATVSISPRMEADTKENGKMVTDMGRVSTSMRTVIITAVSGWKATVKGAVTIAAPEMLFIKGHGREISSSVLGP